MARAMWKGVISFGLVNIPVELFPAIEQKSVQFHLLSPDGTCRLRRKLYCPETGKEYDFDQTSRGYEIAPDQYVIVEEEEIKKLKPEADRAINILDFTDLKSVDPIYYNRSYYLAPDKGGAKGYKLLLEAMKQTKRIGIAKFVMRGTEYLAAIRVMDDNLIGLETMYFDAEIRPASELETAEKVVTNAKELALAKQLVESLYGKFDASQYKNEYREELEDLVEQKAEGKDIVVHDTTDVQRPTKVIDLMAVLKKSVNARKSSKTKRRSATKERTKRKRAA